jgi:hypothetical protein
MEQALEFVRVFLEQQTTSGIPAIKGWQIWRTSENRRGFALKEVEELRRCRWMGEIR